MTEPFVELDPAQRRERIRAIVSDTGFARVIDLSEQFGTSAVTIRSDLIQLEHDRALRRVRGGAVPLSKTTRHELPFEAQAQELATEKYRVGERAAALISPGDTLFIDVGSTTAAFARALVARDDLKALTVITNGLNVALDLENAVPRYTIIVTGGTLRPLQHSLVNPMAETLLATLHAQWAFIGCNGVTAENGITNINVAETDVKRLMIANAEHTVVLADASKIGATTVAQVADIEAVHTLITSTGAEPTQLTAIRTAGTDVVTV